MKQTWDHVAAFKPVIAAVKAHGSLCIGQITHAGRQTSNIFTDHPPAPSAVQCAGFGGMEFGVPRPLEVDEIWDLVKRFGYAAKVLYDAGADGAQLHCAVRLRIKLCARLLSVCAAWLLAEPILVAARQQAHRRMGALSSLGILSVVDVWQGGSLENRSRLHREIAKEIRRLVPDEKFMLHIKINSRECRVAIRPDRFETPADDFIEGGMDAEESKTMCIWLEQAGFTCIELSGGTYEALACGSV